MTITEKANNYLTFFKNGKRNDGSEYVYLENEPEELHESVRIAHGDRFPDDWIYGIYADILQRITEYEPKTIDDLDAFRNEIVDGMVDIYTNQLTKWLHDDINNIYYLTEILEQFEPKDGFQLLSMAQYQAIDEVFSEVYTLLNDDE